MEVFLGAAKVNAAGAADEASHATQRAATARQKLQMVLESKHAGTTP
jgi:hypothetical protein